MSVMSDGISLLRWPVHQTVHVSDPHGRHVAARAAGQLLVGDDVIHPAPHDAGGSGAQLRPDDRAGEDGAVIRERNAGYFPLPRA